MNRRLKQALIGGAVAGIIGALSSLARSPAPSHAARETAAPGAASTMDDLFEKQTLDAMAFAAARPASAASAPR